AVRVAPAAGGPLAQRRCGPRLSRRPGPGGSRWDSSSRGRGGGGSWPGTTTAYSGAGPSTICRCHTVDRAGRSRSRSAWNASYDHPSGFLSQMQVDAARGATSRGAGAAASASGPGGSRSSAAGAPGTASPPAGERRSGRARRRSLPPWRPRGRGRPGLAPRSRRGRGDPVRRSWRSGTSLRTRRPPGARARRRACARATPEPLHRIGGAAERLVEVVDRELVVAEVGAGTGLMPEDVGTHGSRRVGGSDRGRGFRLARAGRTKVIRLASRWQRIRGSGPGDGVRRGSPAADGFGAGRPPALAYGRTVLRRGTQRLKYGPARGALVP